MAMRKLPKLTDKQRFALDCVAKGLVERREVEKPVHMYGAQLVVRIWWALDTDITNQIKALRGRKLITKVYPARTEVVFQPKPATGLVLTDLGQQELTNGQPQRTEAQDG